MQTQRCSRVFSCSKPPLLLPWGQGGREAWVPVSHLLLLFRFKADYNWEESCNMANPPLSQAGSGNQKARGNVTCFPQGKSERHKLFMQIWSVFRRVLRKISGNHFLITHIDCTYCAYLSLSFSPSLPHTVKTSRQDKLFALWLSFDSARGSFRHTGGWAHQRHKNFTVYLSLPISFYLFN